MFMKKILVFISFFLIFTINFINALAVDWTESCPTPIPSCSCLTTGSCKTPTVCIGRFCTFNCPNRDHTTKSSSCIFSASGGTGCNCDVYCIGGSCSGSTCSYLSGSCSYSCTGNWRNCDGNPGNGCECDILSDVNCCGGCGPSYQCTVGEQCYSGTCISPSAKFTSYDPINDTVSKYFLGLGMHATTSWYIWEKEWAISYGSDYVNITRAEDTSKNFTFKRENDIINLYGPDGRSYTFKIKRLRSNEVDFQSLNKSFAFKDFSEKNAIGSKNIIINQNGKAAMTTNNSAIWISDFPKSDEYKTLVKAAILSRKDNWVARATLPNKKTATVSSFMSFCCDMPETAEFYLTLWYEI
jgi:hypothetical protein